MCLASIALGPLAVVRVCFHQIWPWWWRKIVVVADDLAMACQARVGAAAGVGSGSKAAPRGE